MGNSFHTSTATVTAVRHELCFRKAKKNHECEQTGFGRSTALFSSARSRMTSRISPWCATLVWSTHGLVSAFFHVGRQFGASRPSTLACGLRKRPWSFLMGVTIVTPNTHDIVHAHRCMYNVMYTRTHTHKHTHTCKHTRTHAHIYVHTFIQEYPSSQLTNTTCMHL